MHYIKFNYKLKLEFLEEKKRAAEIKLKDNLQLLFINVLYLIFNYTIPSIPKTKAAASAIRGITQVTIPISLYESL